MFVKYFNSPVGRLLIKCSDTALRSVTIGQTARADDRQTDHWILQQTTGYLERYFAGEKVSPASLPLELHGTVFQQQIWQMLLQIPYGCTTTYGLLAQQTAALMQKKSMSAQAVGNAVGANLLLLIVPCHRVLGKGNKLGGFSCGIEIKKKLLEIEHIMYKE